MPPGNSLLDLGADPGLDARRGAAPVDVEAALLAAADLVAALGAPAGSEIARRTPQRMVDGLAELLACPDWEFTTFPNTSGRDDLVLVRNVAFTSICAHHLLPFSGVAHVAVRPGERIAGVSKLARTVAMFAARLQVQEELGQQIAQFLLDRLDCPGVGVVLAAEHLCMTRRGVRASGADMVTLATRGVLVSDTAARSEFLQAIGWPAARAS